ncbi:MAG: hypothetical protein ABII23_07565 [bacterium]
MYKRLIIFMICVITAFPVFSLNIPLTVEELTMLSDTIISGHVAKVEPYWDPGRKFIYSKITVDVDEQYRGETAGDSCEIHMLGGEMEKIGLRVSGYTQPHAGEHMMFFLTKDETKNIYHLPQGDQAKISMNNLTAQQKNHLRSRINNVLQLLHK